MVSGRLAAEPLRARARAPTRRRAYAVSLRAQLVLSCLQCARSRIRFMIVPDMLKNAPMFKRIDPKYKGKALPMGVGGRGRAAAVRAAAKAKAR